MTEFLIDENILGIDRYLDGHVKYRKIGNADAPPKGTPDPNIVNFAKENDLVIVTLDEKLQKQCNVFGVVCIFLDPIATLSNKVLQYD